jgi:hypothetical protein
MRQTFGNAERNRRRPGADGKKREARAKAGADPTFPNRSSGPMKPSGGVETAKGSGSRSSLRFSRTGRIDHGELAPRGRSGREGQPEFASEKAVPGNRGSLLPRGLKRDRAKFALPGSPGIFRKAPRRPTRNPKGNRPGPKGLGRNPLQSSVVRLRPGTRPRKSGGRQQCRPPFLVWGDADGRRISRRFRPAPAREPHEPAAGACMKNRPFRRFFSAIDGP